MKSYEAFFGLLLIVFLFALIVSLLRWWADTQSDKSGNAKQKAKDIISFLEKKTYTFAELRDNLSELTEIKYFNLFEINFKMSDIDDDTKITITLYYSKKEVEKRLYDYYMDDWRLSDVGKIGSMRKV